MIDLEIKVDAAIVDLRNKGLRSEAAALVKAKQIIAECGESLGAMVDAAAELAVSKFSVGDEREAHKQVAKVKIGAAVLTLFAAAK